MKYGIYFFKIRCYIICYTHTSFKVTIFNDINDIIVVLKNAIIFGV